MHVGLVDGEDPLAPGSGGIEGHLRDPDDLGPAVLHGVQGRLPVVDEPAGLCVIEPARQLSHDHQVRAVDAVSTEWRRIREGGQDAYRTDVRVTPHLLPQRQECRLRA